MVVEGHHNDAVSEVQTGLALQDRGLGFFEYILNKTKGKESNASSRGVVELALAYHCQDSEP